MTDDDKQTINTAQLLMGSPTVWVWKTWWSDGEVGVQVYATRELAEQDCDAETNYYFNECREPDPDDKLPDTFHERLEWYDDKNDSKTEIEEYPVRFSAK